MKQRMEELRIDYMDLSHGFFTDESKIKVDFCLPERLIQVCIGTFHIFMKLNLPLTQAAHFLIKYLKCCPSVMIHIKRLVHMDNK